MCDPWYWTLLTFVELLDVERLEGYARRGEALERASWAAIAFHEPKKLKGEAERLRREIQGQARRRSKQDTLEEAKEVMAALSRGVTTEPT